jgi:hypothetical protein
VWVKRSQIDGPRPSSFTAPSIWYDEVAVPHRNPFGKPEGAALVTPPGPDWAGADPVGIDMPNADQPAILPNCRRENLLKGIVSLAAGINQS